MILFENSLLKLDYNPSTDILEVAYPDLYSFLLPEVKKSIDNLLDAVKNYDIKRVLLDASKTVVSVNEEESRELSAYLAAGLAKSRVEKVARIRSESAAVENTAQKNMEYINHAGLFPFQLQTFSSKQDAINWLM